MDSSTRETLDPWSDSEMSSSTFSDSEVPPAVIYAEEEETVSAALVPVNIQDPKMKGLKPVEAVPLRMIPVPYGGKDPVPFVEAELRRLKDQSARVGKREVPIPSKLKSHKSYKEGEWTAFIEFRDDGRKDWTFQHREYRRDFRSKNDVKDFLDFNGPTTGMFKGRKLQKKKTACPDGHHSACTSKSTRVRKAAANYARENVSASHSIKPDMPPGCL
ncbi:hypothetical protein GQ55_8G060000 [Panicum hallii var. hallii]|uniref:Uncharacterized protein n=1 Tax=Panicum hallii var. hallii TaxID=1504633 RepID=A0A2T7CL51_9POAL|nr:hypothetical protein GQ55_8G060000 [Panicum hallii var. hallii]